MKIHKGYKVEISPTEDQKKLFEKAFGTSRFIYNNLLDTCISYYTEHGKSYPRKELKRHLTTIKQEYRDWMYDVPKSVHQNSFDNLMTSYKNFYDGLKKKKKDVAQFPVFKSKHRSNKSFTMDNDRFKIKEHHIWLSVFGNIKMKEINYIPKKNVKYLSATISYKGGKYFCSVNVQKYKSNVKDHTDEVIGIDLGVKTLLTCSNGLVFENPKHYKKKLKKLKRIQRKFSRATKQKKDGYTVYSKRKEKLKLKLQKQHYMISSLRKDNLHKITTSLVKTKPKTIVIEDLNVKGMMKNHNLAQHIADASFGEFRRQLEYKTKLFNIELVLVNRFFPSSKLCNSCGCIKEDLKLSDRIYRCDCGFVMDRDLNASLNLRDYVLNDRLSYPTVGHTESHARGLETNSLQEARIKINSF